MSYVRVSTGYKTLLLGPASWEAVFNGGQINLYSGGIPDDADMGADPDALLAVVKHGFAGLEFVRDRYVVFKLPQHQWEGEVIAPGELSWCRLIGPGDDPSQISFDAPRIDGRIQLASETPQYGTVLMLDIPSYHVERAHIVRVSDFYFSL